MPFGITERDKGDNMDTHNLNSALMSLLQHEYSIKEIVKVRILDDKILFTDQSGQIYETQVKIVNTIRTSNQENN